MTSTLPYSRILLKVSGEALMGDKEFGIDMNMAGRVADEVAQAVKAGTQIALVIGGGNIFRGVAGAAGGMDRANADQMGMLATIMNALAMQDMLGSKGVDARAMSAIPMPTVCESFIRSKALWHLKKGRVVLCAAGTGNPFFTTDTGAALRAAELQCDVLLKGTSVDGVYSDDPKKVPDAKRFDSLTYDDILARNLRVMDGAAVALARDNAIPVIVFSIRKAGELNKVLDGKGTFTRIDV
jgi:uridylate kinase